MVDCAFTMYLFASTVLSPCALTGALFAGINLSAPVQGAAEIGAETGAGA